MKLLVVSNSLNTVPATVPESATNFRSYFNQVVKLPKYCQICILSSTVVDANEPKLHYVAIPSLPLKTYFGSGEKGNQPKVVGSIISNVSQYQHNWVDLDNPSELTLTEMDIQILNQDAEVASGLSGLTELMFGYRQDPAMKGTTQY